jgi:hypothetical protein
MRFCWLAVAVALAGCTAIVEPGDSRLSVAVDASPRALAPGDSVLIRVRLLNDSWREAELTFPSGCQLGFRIVSPAGNEVGRGCGAVQAVTHLTIPGRGSVQKDFYWHALSPAGDPVPPGEYALLGMIGEGLRYSLPVALSVLGDGE